MRKIINKPLKVAFIGYGYWGPNLVRNFNENEETRIIACCDLKIESLKIVRRKYPGVRITTKIEEIFTDNSIEAVVIATPISTHFKLAKMALLSGKHVWIEKPMTQTSGQAKELIKIAKQKNKILHVDHVFLYTEAVQSIKKLIDSGEIGKTYYFDSVRINLGLFQPDNNVIWDLAPHDISIMCYLLDQIPEFVSVFATSHVIRNLEDTAYVGFRFKNDVSAHVHVSWLSPVKIRRSLIAGNKKMIVYDDLEGSEKVKLYDKGVAVPIEKIVPRVLTTSGYQYRSGDILAPALASKEALQTECTHFISCIRNGKKSLTSGDMGLQIVKILEACEKSLKRNGEIVKIT